jgi:hypothetical protein
MARVLSEVLDRPVRFQQISGAEYGARLRGYGASEAWVRGLTDMAAAIDAQGFYGIAAPSTPETAPTSFRQWCEEVLRPAVLG